MTDFEIRDATVLEREPGGLLVRVDDNITECGGCGSCVVKSLCRGRDGAHFDVRVPVPEGRADKIGDRIRIAYRGANPAIASIVMFLPALVGVLSGGFIANAVFGEADYILLLGAFAGLLLGFGATYALARVSPLRPEVRLVDSGEGG